MKIKIYFASIVLLFCFTGVSCYTTYQSQSLQYKSYRINDNQQKDSALLTILQPYSTTVNATMNEVVGIASKSLDKKQPESTLGNFLADAYFTIAQEKYNTKVDAAFANIGGIRLNQLSAGNITNGKIFELMPFDNLLILQKLKGDVLQQFLDLTAADGGWPLAGITMQIKDKKAVNVMVGEKPLNPDVIYITVNSDYIANGGGGADMLRKVPQISNGYLMRDAIFEYIKKLKAQGKDITANIENRVINVQ